MLTRAELEALLEQVRKATGPDQGLGIDIILALLDPNGTDDRDVRLGRIVIEHGKLLAWTTESIDAALSLVERVLPEANCYGAERDPKGWEAYVSRNHVKSGHWYFGGWHSSSAPLAILSALLSAKIAKVDHA